MKFAVIDTETTWTDKVMSIGVVIADGKSIKALKSKYYIINPEFRSGGMFSGTINDAPKDKTFVMSRLEAIQDIKSLLTRESVNTIFAYNANFDYKHLPELNSYTWVDIMKIAAYRQYNQYIPKNAQCCGTGRLKSGYGVEAILNMMVRNYQETHNAYYDAIDELKIVELLGLDIKVYKKAII
ncbi:MAG: hypothetical protein IKS48_08750 [Eubacterium sp.]|nr:hypothetical protein [Eubacterium sp.]